MHADLESIVCKFGGDPAICLREEVICAKVYRRTDGRTDVTDDGRLAIALAHYWNELKMSHQFKTSSNIDPLSKSLHWRSQQQICNTEIIIDPTTVQTRPVAYLQM